MSGRLTDLGDRVEGQVMGPDLLKYHGANQNAAQNSSATNGPRDLILQLYREIGISAVAAALEASARKPQGLIQCRNDPAFPSVPAAHERIGHRRIVLAHVCKHS